MWLVWFITHLWQSLSLLYCYIVASLGFKLWARLIQKFRNIDPWWTMITVLVNYNVHDINTITVQWNCFNEIAMNIYQIVQNVCLNNIYSICLFHVMKIHCMYRFRTVSKSLSLHDISILFIDLLNSQIHYL